MKKFIPVLVVVALVLAACGSGAGGNETAATVNGTDVTVGDVERLMVTDDSTIDKANFAQFLGFEIQWEIVEQATQEQFGIEVTDAEVDAEADRIYDSTNQGESREEFVLSRGVTEEFLRNIARQGLIDAEVRAEFEDEATDPTQDEIDSEMAVAEASFTEVCVSHILVPTEEEAQAVVVRLEAGEDFATVAEETSSDTGSAVSGGVLPCGSAGQYVPPFRDAAIVAPVGELYDEIVESQFGFHVMLVTDRTDPNIEDLPTEQEVIDSLKGQAVGVLVNAWFLEQIDGAVVVVDAEFGTWVTDPQPAVIPPEV
ncbi:MAG: peptidylprolyl isomerase [Acidimicrobiia bacterium]